MNLIYTLNIVLWAILFIRSLLWYFALFVIMDAAENIAIDDQQYPKVAKMIATGELNYRYFMSVVYVATCILFMFPVFQYGPHPSENSLVWFLCAASIITTAFILFSKSIINNMKLPSSWVALYMCYNAITVMLGTSYAN